MTRWTIRDANPGYSVFCEDDTGKSLDYGTYESHTIYRIMRELSELLSAGDLVDSPEGLFFVQNDKKCYNPTNPTNN